MTTDICYPRRVSGAVQERAVRFRLQHGRKHEYGQFRGAGPGGGRIDPGNHHWRRTGTACRLGRLVITSGLNATFQRSIRNWDGASTLQFLNPLPYPVAVNPRGRLTAGL
jgi:hypothetical protein